MPDELPGWVMRQTWTDLLFAHWPAAIRTLRACVPAALEIDTFEGRGWIAVVPFGMSGIRGRLMPPVPGLASTLELNVRTYVRYRGRPGVYFFSLDAASRGIVRGARWTYHLPYFDARMSWNGGLYSSRRIHRGAPPAEFVARYGPAGQEFRSPDGSLESFLTDRFSLFTVHRGQVYRGDIAHTKWPLQLAEAEFERNTMTEAVAIPLSGQPLLHYSRSIDVRIGRIRREAD